MNYKKLQKWSRDKSNRIIARYDSGKRFSKSGEVRIKGVPYVNEEKQKLKEERKARKLARKDKSE